MLVSSKYLPVSIINSSANNQDFTKFIETLEYILYFMISDSLKQIRHCFPDKWLSMNNSITLERQTHQCEHYNEKKQYCATVQKKTVKNQIRVFYR